MCLVYNFRIIFRKTSVIFSQPFGHVCRNSTRKRSFRTFSSRGIVMRFTYATRKAAFCWSIQIRPAYVGRGIQIAVHTFSINSVLISVNNSHIPFLACSACDTLSTFTLDADEVCEFCVIAIEAEALLCTFESVSILIRVRPRLVGTCGARHLTLQRLCVICCRSLDRIDKIQIRAL